MMIRMRVPNPMYTHFSFSRESAHTFPARYFANRTGMPVLAESRSKNYS